MDVGSQILNDLKTTESNPQAYVKTCTECGMKFATHEDKKDMKLCLRCQVIKDMKIPKDTIVNINILNLWKADRYSKSEGLDPILCGVSEGVILLDRPVKKRDHLSGFKYKSKNKGNADIEKYIRSLMYRANGQYDAIVILRFNTKDSFNVFCVRFSDRVVKKLKNKPTTFIKKFAVSLVVRHYLKDVKNK